MGEAQSELDILTGFMNRKTIEARLHILLDQAQAEDQPLSISLLDIDHFKEINDRWGHSTGDHVLRTLAAIIHKTVAAEAQVGRLTAGEKAQVGRYGGDEFILLFANTEREAAFLTMERLRLAVESSPDFADQAKGQDFQVHISAGVATYPIDGHTSDELLRSAHQAIYRAKTTGRNTVRLAYEDKMVPKTAHYTQTQIERLSKLAEREGVGEATLLREALDYLLIKYEVTHIER
ncbi:MAG: GGDEF domain-containing protein [Anaerolineales bacterium]|nr:GGDEF domain-containing protein [Anaerolineales bacterium]